MRNFISRLGWYAGKLRRYLQQLGGALQPGEGERLPEHTKKANDFEVTVDYLAQYKVARVTARGILSLEANNRLVSAALAASKQYDTNLLLVDDRNIEIGMDFVNVYDLPEHNQMRGVARNLRVALIYTPSRDMDQLFKFYENRSHVMDFKHCVFTDENQALRWLTGR